MMLDYRTIAETNNFIVLDKYTKCSQVCEGYQTEYDLEGELIQDKFDSHKTTYPQKYKQQYPNFVE